MKRERKRERERERGEMERERKRERERKEVKKEREGGDKEKGGREKDIFKQCTEFNLLNITTIIFTTHLRDKIVVTLYALFHLEIKHKNIFF